MTYALSGRREKFDESGGFILISDHGRKIASDSRGLNVPLIIMLALTPWIVSGTGLASDDLALALVHRTASSGTLIPTIHTIAFPVEHYTHTLAYHYFGTESVWGYEILKSIYAMISLWMVARFFSLYLDPWRSSIAAFLFIYLPNHDATVFWFIGQYLMLSISAYCYGFYQIRCGRLASGVVLSALASFISYGSTPVAVGLALLALLEGRRKDAVLIFAPNAIYVAYYFAISVGLGLGPQRLPSNLDFLGLLRQFAVQILTFADANLGPSFFMKMALSIAEISIVQFAVAIVAIALIWQRREISVMPARKTLFLALSAIAILALGTFSLTGRYPQIAFNLGNRVTIYGSLLISYCLVSFSSNRGITTLVFLATLLSALGLSTHWKNWSNHQEKVSAQIANNSNIAAIPNAELVAVTGNQYSKLGPLSHLEFFSENYVVNTVFSQALGESRLLTTLNRRHSVIGENLYDKKYNESSLLPENVWVYDSEQDRVFQVPRTELDAYIETLPKDARHWLQLMPPGWIMDGALKLMPRLKYAL